MTRFVFFSLLYLIALSLPAQTGSYFLTHHSPTEKNFDNICFDMTQDQNGVMYFAMKAGVLEFDGREWDLLPGAGAIYALNRNAKGEIFWAGAKGFGKIGFDDRGFRQIQYLFDSTASDVFKTLVTGDEVYFLAQNKIYRYTTGQSKAEVIITGSAQNVFAGLFELFGVVYVQTERNATFKIEKDRLVYVNLNIPGVVIFHSHIDDDYVLGTSDNKVYTCKRDLVMHPVPILDQPYADANVVVNGAWVNPDLLALGTLRGGVMLVNPITGKRDQIIDYSTGLPDNEVFCLMADANENIWVAHEYGFTQISPGMPFRSFSHYPGLDGNMLCAYSYNNDVYVGTSVGLFKLKKEDVYADVVSFVDVEIPKKTSNAKGQTQAPAGTSQPGLQEEPPSKRRNIFNFLRRNRKKEANNEVAAEKGPAAPADDKKPGRAAPRQEKKVDHVLQSSHYVFSKVKGIDAKITHLVETGGRLIAAGLEGVFEIQGEEAKTILNSPTRYLYSSPLKQTIIVSTYNDEILSLKPDGEKWQQMNLINGLGDQIDYIFEGAKNEWWLCGLDKVYQLILNEEGIERLQTIPLSNPNFEKTVGVFYDSAIFFVNTDGFFRFERTKNSLHRIDSLSKPAQYFALSGHILYRDEHRWHVFGSSVDANNIQFLNLFQNLRFITTDQNPENLWLISGSNELLKFYGEAMTLIRNQFPIFVKSIHNNSTTFANFQHIRIDQLNSAVTFEVVQPDFINPNSIEFRYRLEGMNQSWSEWSSANDKIHFPLLPPGQYNLKVEARNVFGKISELQPLPFEVEPPYWREGWFYGLEFAVFAGLVILSFRLSTRYRIISRFLSLITIILLIEFIQTIIGSSIGSADSPVDAFFIQFVVALMILPVEGYLRKLMLRSLDNPEKLYGLIPLRDGKGKSRGSKRVKEPL
jgi:hypothetical protein